MWFVMIVGSMRLVSELNVPPMIFFFCLVVQNPAAGFPAASIEAVRRNALHALAFTGAIPALSAVLIIQDNGEVNNYSIGSVVA